MNKKIVRNLIWLIVLGSLWTIGAFMTIIFSSVLMGLISLALSVCNIVFASISLSTKKKVFITTSGILGTVIGGIAALFVIIDIAIYAGLGILGSALIIISIILSIAGSILWLIFSINTLTIIKKTSVNNEDQNIKDTEVIRDVNN